MYTIRLYVYLVVNCKVLVHFGQSGDYLSLVPFYYLTFIS